MTPSPSPRSGRRALWRAGALALLVGVTVASVAYVVVQVDLPAMGRAIVTYDPLALALGTLLLFGTLITRTWRLRVLLPRRVDWLPLLSVMSIGSLAMAVVPLRAGELVRPYLLSERHGFGFGESLGVIVVERLMDLTGLLVLLLIVLRSLDLEAQVMVGGVDVLSAGLLAAQTTTALAAVVVLALVALGERVLAPLRWMLGAAPTPAGQALLTQATALVGSMRVVSTNPARLAEALLATAVIWSLSCAMGAAVVWGLDGVQVTAAIGATFWAGCITSMTLFPSPGFVGTFEAAGVAALVVHGVSTGPAGAAAVVQHTVMLGSYVVLGLGFTLSEGRRFGDLVRASRGDGGAPSAPVP